MAKANPYLPEETLECIFLWLPVKSLMQCRCVCKLWYQIISSASFINVQRKTTKEQYLLCTQSRFHAFICKEDFTNYRTYYSRPGVFALSQEFVKYNLYHFTRSNLYGTPWCDQLKVYGSCDGLLCLTDEYLRPYIDIFLLNPFIRKAKTIRKIPFELHQDSYRGAALCLGYFDDDYKVIRVSFLCGVCWVGVYSLRTDCWKITNCGRNQDFFLSNLPCICVGGVAYFAADVGKIVCFDLSDEKIDEILIPEALCSSHWMDHHFAVEACGESIALVQIKDGYLEKWVLGNRNATINNSYTWMQSQAPSYISSGIVGTYVLRDISRQSDIYLCSYTGIISKVEGCREHKLPKNLMTIDIHTGNLVLLNERTVTPDLEEEAETCSTPPSMLILYKEKGRIKARKNKHVFF